MTSLPPRPSPNRGRRRRRWIRPGAHIDARISVPRQHGARLVGARGGVASLQAATPNKGGHRERAMRLIERAMGEVQAGIDFASEHGGGGY
jgi:hypothetical protein